MSILNLQANWQAGRELVGILWRHRGLTFELTRRDLTDQYAGQILGVIWAFIHPAILIGIYVFIFSFVFSVRMQGVLQPPRDYTTYLLAGLVPWLVSAAILSKGCSLLLSHANLVKQVIFPIEVLPVKSVLAGAASQLISTAILFGYVLISQMSLPWTILLLPVLLIVQILGLVGICCVLAPVGAYFRDLRELMQILTMVGVYLIPVVYEPNMVPRYFQPLLYLNPASYMAWCYQDVWYFGRIEHPVAWIVFPLLSLVSFVLGYRTFRSLKPMLGNVL